MSDLVLTDVSKTYDGRPVLQDITLRIAAGERYCIQGRSGIGKTTLLRIMAGLVLPDSGTVEGIPEKIGFVFQEDRLCEAYSALSNVRLVTGRNLPKEKILRHLEELELRDRALLPVRDFSGGMKRRVAIARAICADSDLILLDEPFKGLDGGLRDAVIKYVLRHTAGRTLICVTHEETEARQLGGRIINLGN